MPAADAGAALTNPAATELMTMAPMGSRNVAIRRLDSLRCTLSSPSFLRFVTGDIGQKCPEPKGVFLTKYERGPAGQGRRGQPFRVAAAPHVVPTPRQPHAVRNRWATRSQRDADVCAGPPAPLSSWRSVTSARLAQPPRPRAVPITAPCPGRPVWGRPGCAADGSAGGALTPGEGRARARPQCGAGSRRLRPKWSRRTNAGTAGPRRRRRRNRWRSPPPGPPRTGPGPTR